MIWHHKNRQIKNRFFKIRERNISNFRLLIRHSDWLNSQTKIHLEINQKTRSNIDLNIYNSKVFSLGHLFSVGNFSIFLNSPKRQQPLKSTFIQISIHTKTKLCFFPTFLVLKWNRVFICIKLDEFLSLYFVKENKPLKNKNKKSTFWRHCYNAFLIVIKRLLVFILSVF